MMRLHVTMSLFDKERYFIDDSEVSQSIYFEAMACNSRMMKMRKRARQKTRDRLKRYAGLMLRVYGPKLRPYQNNILQGLDALLKSPNLYIQQVGRGTRSKTIQPKIVDYVEYLRNNPCKAGPFDDITNPFTDPEIRAKFNQATHSRCVLPGAIKYPAAMSFNSVEQAEQAMITLGEDLISVSCWYCGLSLRDPRERKDRIHESCAKLDRNGVH